MEKDAKVYVAGHTGMIGSAICRKLREKGFSNIVVKNHKELDLTRQQDVEDFFREVRPKYVINAAGKVGGINANIQYPALFITENLAMQTNIIQSAYSSGVEKMLFFGISCAYPCEASQPLKEESLLSGYLESTSEAYAIAKIAGIEMSQAYSKQYGVKFLSTIPASPYGVNDNFDSESSHVVPALILKFHEAKMQTLPSVSIWGTGKPLREFIYVDDVADAALFLMDNYDDSELINIGTGEEVSIAELVSTVRDVVGYEGDIIYDTSKTDGAMRKLLDAARIRQLGWKPKTTLHEGIEKTYEWYLNRSGDVRKS